MDEVVRPYDVNAKCPACGVSGAKSRFRKGGAFDHKAGQPTCVILRSCSNCGYKWRELPMLDEAPKTDQSVTPPAGSAAKGTAWLSYLGILWLIPLLTNKNNAFAKFHVKQGIMLTILWVASSVLAAIPIVGWLADLVIWVYALIMMIMGIINSLNGKYWNMPILGKWAAEWFKF
jgi:uncharacterized membrane protein